MMVYNIQALVIAIIVQWKALSSTISLFCDPESHMAITGQRDSLLACVYYIQQKPVVQFHCFLLNPIMLTNPNPLLGKFEWCRYCIHLGNLTFCHFEMVEAMGL
jgi:hypothetical protein